MLTIADVEKLLGYNRESVNRWIRHQWLKVTNVRTEPIIAREWLIDFLCGYGWRIAKKSEKHRALLERFYHSDGNQKKR